VPDSTFRQRAAEQAAIRLKAMLAERDAREPFCAAIGSVRIALRACVGRPCYVGPNGVERRAETDRTVIVLSMSNPDGAASVRYEAWGNGAPPHDDAVAHAALSDDLGSRYALAATDRGLERWVGQLNGSRSLGPGETLADLLVFAQPNPTARTLTLELPRANCGGTSGILRVELPVSRIANFPTPQA
jgi:hypothetical protein